MFDAGKTGQSDHEGMIRDQDREKFGNLAAPNWTALAGAFADAFLKGEAFGNIQIARRFAAARLGGAIEAGTRAA